MPDLIARGHTGETCWRRALPAQPITLGRTSKSDWQVPGDQQISGLHATLVWQDGKLRVAKTPTARNQIFVRGAALDEFLLAVGEQFVIGATTFTLEETPRGPVELPTPLSELTCSRHELAQVRYSDADQRIEVLAALPGLIRYSPSNEELECRIIDALLRGIPRADAAAIVWLNPAATGELLDIQVRCATGRDAKAHALQPSRRLVYDALHRRRQSVMHRWLAGQQAGDFTASPGSDWAMCAPLPDEPSPGWGLYVTGHRSDLLASPGEEHYKSDLKFAELVADIFGALRQVRDLQQRQSTLASFLSRPVLAALADADMAEVLRPRETEVTVLFCDLRGSCRIAEDAEHELIGTCDRLNEALSVMTTNIIDKDGVIGDFQGDAAMGFWGWPLSADDQIEQAARAALAIRRDMARAAQKSNHPLAGFACGIGIAHGRAVAGRLGTVDQFKVGVFGPVVNLASRLESMTKFFRVPILVDESVAQRLTTGRNSHWARCRRLARVQPYGMRKTLMVSELPPPAVEPGTMTERDRRDYEAALDAFLVGRWQDARGLLDRLPHDAGAFLKDYMARHAPPAKPDWNGVIALETK